MLNSHFYKGIEVCQFKTPITFFLYFAACMQFTTVCVNSSGFLSFSIDYRKFGI